MVRRKGCHTGSSEQKALELPKALSGTPVLGPEPEMGVQIALGQALFGDLMVLELE